MLFALLALALADEPAPRPEELGPAEPRVLHLALGVAWVPTGIGALAWQDDDRLSGSLVGEFDGWIRPPLTGHAGWIGQRDAVFAGFGALVLHDRAYADVSTVQAVGAFRPELDYRRYLRARAAGAANAYLTGGGYAVLPYTADRSDAYTADEQADADEGRQSLRAQIGGFGGQLGLGGEYVFADRYGRPAVALGLMGAARLYRGQSVQEDAYRVSKVWMTEAALVFELYLSADFSPRSSHVCRVVVALRL